MESQAPNSGSAPGPALGFMVQVDYALLFVLRRMEADVDFEVSLETADDIVLHDPTTTGPTDLIQTKFHVSRTASLGDSSSEIWKTLGNWIAFGGPSRPRLFLLTTTAASPGSAAFCLKENSERDVEAALAALRAVAAAGGSTANGPTYEAFLQLSDPQQKDLLERVTVVDGSEDASQLNDALLLAVRKSVFPNRRQALVDRLRGWWQRRVVRHLVAVANRRVDRIAVSEVEDYLLAVAQTLRDDDLPIDYLDLEQPKEKEVDEDTRIFVQQLRLIQMASARLRQCIYDHNRAFLQRSRWQREDLLNVGELGRYDEMLKDEWRRYFLPVSADNPAKTEADRIADAQEAFQRLDTSPLPRIRLHVSAGYVANGSLHMLADRLELGWHPRWLEHLQHRLGEVEAERSA